MSRSIYLSVFVSRKVNNMSIDYRRLRGDLIHNKPLDRYSLKDISPGELCDESLKIFFELCKDLRLWDKALVAGRLLDRITQPRRGNLVDEGGGYFAQRASRIDRASRGIL
jgi:hypothetical protein